VMRRSPVMGVVSVAGVIGVMPVGMVVRVAPVVAIVAVMPVMSMVMRPMSSATGVVYQFKALRHGLRLRHEQAQAKDRAKAHEQSHFFLLRLAARQMFLPVSMPTKNRAHRSQPERAMRPSAPFLNLQWLTGKSS